MLASKQCLKRKDSQFSEGYTNTDFKKVAAKDNIWVFPKMTHHVKAGKSVFDGPVRDKPGKDNTMNGTDQCLAHWETAASEKSLERGEAWCCIDPQDFQNEDQWVITQNQSHRSSVGPVLPTNPTRDDEPLEISYHEPYMLSFIQIEEPVEDLDLSLILSDSVASDANISHSPTAIPEQVSISDICHSTWENSNNNKPDETQNNKSGRYRIHVILGLSVTVMVVILQKWVSSAIFFRNKYHTPRLEIRDLDWPQNINLLSKLQHSIKILSQKFSLYCTRLLNNSAETRKALGLLLCSLRESATCALQGLWQSGSIFF